MIIDIIKSLALAIFINFALWIVFFVPLKQHNPRLYNIITICYLLHLLLLCVLNIDLYKYAISWHSAFFNDGECYVMHSKIISAILKNKPLDYIASLRVGSGWVSDWTYRGMVPPANTYQIGYISYLYAILFSVFGYYPFIISLWNIALHMMSGVLVFKISKIIFDEKAGYIAATLFLFNPVLFYYSTAKLAEASYIFLICLILYLCITMSIKEVRSFMFYFSRLSIAGVALYLFYLLKSKLFFPVLISILLYLFSIIIIRKKKLRLTLVLIVSIIVLAGRHKLLSILNTIFLSLVYYHHEYTMSGGQVYHLLKFGNNYVNYTLFQKLAYMILSWTHFIAEPMQFSSILYLLYYPFQIIFIILFIFALFGMVISVKTRRMPALLLIFYFFFMSGIIAGASGNVGTMLRHRDVVSFIMFIFAAFYINIMLNKFKYADRL